MRPHLHWLNRNNDEQLLWAKDYLNKHAAILKQTHPNAPVEVISSTGWHEIYEQITEWAERAQNDEKQKGLREKLGRAWSQKKYSAKKGGKRARSLVLQEATKKQLDDFARSRSLPMTVDDALQLLLACGTKQTNEIERRLSLKASDAGKVHDSLKAEITRKTQAIDALNRLLRESVVDQSILELQLEQARQQGLTPAKPPAKVVEDLSKKLLSEALRRELENLGTKDLGVRSLTQLANYPDLKLIELRLNHMREGKPLTHRAKRIDTLLRKACLRNLEASLNSIDTHPARGLNIGRLRSLEPCTWIECHQNVIITGMTGRGKTWLACALGRQACEKRWRVRYYSQGDLLDELATARDSKKFQEARKVLSDFDLLIIDNFDLTELTTSQYQDLLEIIDSRVQCRSTLVASCTNPSQWRELIRDNEAARMLIDRLAYAPHQFHLQGESMREKMARLAPGCNPGDSINCPPSQQSQGNAISPMDSPREVAREDDVTSNESPAIVATETHSTINTQPENHPSTTQDINEPMPTPESYEKLLSLRPITSKHISSKK
ncbi:ATP-binding protein [Pseudomonas sp. BN411]|uniref:ATP-binding protein n=1 Tax=Pseudomonas sp. BN411 TaxID=2567887 RepID=UPI00245760B9|nr:ATP-binding protein [Pseudomonas sp. BN411]